MHGVANVLRPSAEAKPLDGILAAEAACQIGQCMYNFIAHPEGQLSMKPLRCIPDPPREHFEYEASTNKLVMTTMDCHSVWMPCGRGLDAEREPPRVLKMLGIGGSKGEPIEAACKRSRH